VLSLANNNPFKKLLNLFETNDQRVQKNTTLFMINCDLMENTTIYHTEYPWIILDEFSQVSLCKFNLISVNYSFQNLLMIN